MFLFLEGEEAVLMERVVALIRDSGETVVLTRDAAVRSTGFTPFTLDRRSKKFWNDATKWKERQRACQRQWETLKISKTSA